MKKEILLENIENYRQKLYKLMHQKGKVDQQVIITSQKLDDLLNKYEKYFSTGPRSRG